MGVSRRPRALASMALIVLAAGSAAAQTTIDDPQAIGVCLCLERSMAERSEAMRAAERRHAAVRAEIDAERRALDQEREQVDVSDPGAIDRFRVRLDRLLAADQLLQAELFPAWQAAIDRFEEHRRIHAARCAGRILAPYVVDRVRPSLECRLD